MARGRRPNPAEGAEKNSTIMDEAENDVLAYMTFPKEHRVNLHPPTRSSGSMARSTGGPKS